MNKKGQSAFEVAFLLGVLLILVMISAGRYLSIQDQNTAMAYAKLKALENLEAENSFYYLQAIEPTEIGGGINLSITTKPNDLASFSEPTLCDIAKEIKNRTGYSSVTIALNGNSKSDTDTC